jgi:hypothetical protein
MVVLDEWAVIAEIPAGDVPGLVRCLRADGAVRA